MFVLAALLLAGGAPLVVGTLADPVSLEPARATDLVSAAIVENVCETLVRQGTDGASFDAALATGWATRDGRTWTFTLREGVRFHDGTPFDADAVVANIEWLRERRGFAGAASRVGPHAVSLTLHRPSAALLATLSQPFFALQSPSALGSGEPVGTGPFRLGRVGEGRIELLANPEYWGGAPASQGVTFRRLRNQAALAAALRRGEVDVTTALSQDEAAALKERPDVTLDVRTGLNIALLSLNTERPPFDDVRVRQALARAIDREKLVGATLRGYGEAARNPLPPSVWGYGQRTRELVYDPAAARKLLALAGLPGGLEVTLLAVDAARPYLPAPLELAELLRSQLASVGLRPRVEIAASWIDYVERGRRGDYEMAVFGWQADTTDPNDFLSTLLASESIGTTNRSRYRSDDMDGLLKLGRRIATASERLAVYDRVQDLFQRDMPWIPLYHASVFTAARSEIEGLRAGPTGLLRYETARRRE